VSHVHQSPKWENIMICRRSIQFAAMFGILAFLTGCQIEASAPMRAFDVKNTATTGVPVPVNVILTASFASKDWCGDEGNMAIRALGSADVPIQPISCKADAGGAEAATGQFQLTTSLVKTTGAANPQIVVSEVLNQDLVRFAVFPHARYDKLLSVGIFLNVAKLEAAKAQLLAMPVFQRGGDTANITLSLSIVVTNDLPNMQKFYLNNVSADIDPSYAESVLELPSGASETITLDDAAEAKLMQQGWVNFFAMDNH
jgi:hypothetical protein